MKDTAQPKLSVHIPKVNLRLEDVAYLRSLSGPQKIKCSVPTHRLDRRRILGLIEDADIPALPQAVKEAEEQIAKMKILLAKYLKDGDFKVFYNGSRYSDPFYTITCAHRQKEPTKGLAITDLGRQLLAQGEVTVKMQKKGCL